MLINVFESAIIFAMNKHYYSLNEYLQNTFGEKVYKLSVDLGLSCPNRDGTLDTRGCIFCLAGSSHFASQSGSISARIDEAKALVAKKTKATRFVAYFQSYTNTYAPVEYLKSVFYEVIARDDIVALSIATRPDCLPAEILSLLGALNKIKPIWVELGLQTANEKTAEYIRRCYPDSVYVEAVRDLKKLGINVITHIILGLPNETADDALASVDLAVESGTDGVKLQLLHVLRGTDLYADYIKGSFSALTLEEYTDILFACIERLPENVVIHRITGDAPKKHLAAPLWSADKKTVLNTLNREMEMRGVRQGRCRK